MEGLLILWNIVSEKRGVCVFVPGGKLSHIFIGRSLAVNWLLAVRQAEQGGKLTNLWGCTSGRPVPLVWKAMSIAGIDKAGVGVGAWSVFTVSEPSVFCLILKLI